MKKAWMNISYFPFILFNLKIFGEIVTRFFESVEFQPFLNQLNSKQILYKICYKLIVIDIAFNEFFTYAEFCYNLRRHHLCIRSKYLPKHDSFRHFFSNRVVPVWNLLPKSIVSSSSLSAFKMRLKKFDLHEICS